MFIDTHCHLNDDKYQDVDAVIKSYLHDGVDIVINMGCEYQSSEFGKNLAQKYDSVYFAAGYHPSDVDSFSQENLDKISALANHDKCVAIGEIGLDYHWQPFDKDKQKNCFISQIELAKSLKLPVSIHSRDATCDMLNLLKENKSNLQYGAVMHCYSGSVETARELLNLGVYISFAGPVTFKNAGKLVEVASFVPTDMILTETDSPYLAPHPFRGTINEPKNVSLVTAFLASLRGENLQDFSAFVMKNAKTLFKKLK